MRGASAWFLPSEFFGFIKIRTKQNRLAMLVIKNKLALLFVYGDFMRIKSSLRCVKSTSFALYFQTVVIGRL